MGDIPFQRRDHPLDDPRARRTAHVEVARHGHRPARADRRARRRRDALRPAEDVVDAGRALLGAARSRRAASSRTSSGTRAGCCCCAGGGEVGRAAVVGRGAVDPRAHRRDARRARGAISRVRLRARRRPPVPPDVRRLLRLVSRGDQAAARATPDVQATAFAALERLLALLHPVMPHVTEEIWSHLPAATSRLIVAPWPQADDRYAADVGRARARADGGAHLPAQRRAHQGRAATRCGSSRRSCGRPADGQGDVEARARARARRRSSARSGCSRTRSSWRTRAPDVVDAEREKLEQYRAELDALGG